MLGGRKILYINMIKWIQPPSTFYIYSIAWLVLHERKDFYCWLVFSQRTMQTSLHLAKNCMKLFKILISSDVKFKINIKSWVSFLINFIYLVHIYSSQSIDMPKCLLSWNTILFLLSVLEANSPPIFTNYPFTISLNTHLLYVNIEAV